jgi:hypothetical protein
MIRLRWVFTKPDGRELVLADGPIRFGGDEHSDVVISITVPHELGGNVRSDVVAQVGSSMTLALTLEADPPDGP